MKYYDILKNCFEFILSIVLLIITLPICLIVCFAIYFELRVNPIYTQKRVGLNGHVFKIYKLRSMYIDAEKDGPKWASENDERITKVGRIIRKL